MSNFVNIVGYQLEKVHTGTIKHCLEFRQGENLSSAKYETLCNLYQYLEEPPPFQKKDIVEIKCFPEYSFGRKVRVDLLIRISTRDHKYYFACEMKVDSDPYKRQLDQTVDSVSSRFGTENVKYLLVLLGASSVSREVGDNHEYFSVIDPSNLLKIFSPCKFESDIAEQWLAALSEEISRDNSAVHNFISLYPDNVWSKQKIIDMGYRPYFSLYYYLYSHLRQKFNESGEWAIYSGGNNPVMNWKSGWKIIGNFRFYWEFNYLEYCFKVKIDRKKVTRESLNQLRDLVSPILGDLASQGRAAQRRYGEWNSLYKWGFDLQKQGLQEVCRIIEEQIHPNYSKILEAVENVLPISRGGRK